MLHDVNKLSVWKIVGTIFLIILFKDFLKSWTKCIMFVAVGYSCLLGDDDGIMHPLCVKRKHLVKCDIANFMGRVWMKCGMQWQSR